MTGRSFISYSHEDAAESALRLARYLKAEGADVWLDQLNMSSGPWDATIKQALTDCERVIVILTPCADQSVNVRTEVAYGLKIGKEIIPVRMLECDPPFQLEIFHHIDFVNRYELGLAELLREINLADSPKPKPAEPDLPLTRLADPPPTNLPLTPVAPPPPPPRRWLKLSLFVVLIAGGTAWYLRPKATIQEVPCEPSWPAEGKTYAADREGMNNGCQSGVLSLERSAMVFTCPDKPNKSVYAAIDDIAGADGEGVILNSGQKYHFKIQGMNGQQVQALFAQWSSGVCKSPSQRGGFVPSNE
jgi:TIR domain